MPQRLALPATVVEATQSARRHLVVHRDPEPGSILVTGDGVVTLLDFGLAKLVPGASPPRLQARVAALIGASGHTGHPAPSAETAERVIAEGTRCVLEWTGALGGGRRRRRSLGDHQGPDSRLEGIEVNLKRRGG